jgi:putative methylase
MYSKKELELLLQRCETFENPKVLLEQYITPAPIAADMLNAASLSKDIKDKLVFDLGCGTGRLAIGSALNGARKVVGFDVDPDVLKVARRNAKKLDVDAVFECLDVADLDSRCDTVVQNPPFGVKKKGADLIFLKSALKAGKVIYTMHKSATRDFIRRYIERLGGKATDINSVKFALPYSYGYHKKRIKMIEVDIYRIERRD